mmetsp:Transcript_53058/g.121066  ORF Transcript_53058/g.121066 Transcript_53058/m.121066 type:complete len:183 (-) Transcript_53058:1480-2028(-)
MASWAQRGDAPAYGTGVVGLGARLVDDGRWGGSVPSPDPMGPSTLAMPAVPHFAESGSYGGWSAAQNSQDVGPPIQEQRVSPDSGGTGVLPDQVEIGSVVEIFSKGLQAWFVGLVVQESADREVIRVRKLVLRVGRGFAIACCGVYEAPLLRFDLWLATSQRKRRSKRVIPSCATRLGHMLR